LTNRSPLLVFKRGWISSSLEGSPSARIYAEEMGVCRNSLLSKRGAKTLRYKDKISSSKRSFSLIIGTFERPSLKSPPVIEEGLGSSKTGVFRSTLIDETLTRKL
jgi:hypothetical protein